MWIPHSAEDVIAALAAGTLIETHTFDGKAMPGKNNLDVATDVCAMTPDGGSLLYGVGEDSNKRLTLDTPFELAGVPERIDPIVQSSISEVPTIHVKTHPLPGDPSRGYVSRSRCQCRRARRTC